GPYTGEQSTHCNCPFPGERTGGSRHLRDVQPARSCCGPSCPPVHTPRVRLHLPAFEPIRCCSPRRSEPLAPITRLLACRFQPPPAEPRRRVNSGPPDTK